MITVVSRYRGGVPHLPPLKVVPGSVTGLVQTSGGGATTTAVFGRCRRRFFSCFSAKNRRRRGSNSFGSALQIIKGGGVIVTTVVSRYRRGVSHLSPSKVVAGSVTGAVFRFFGRICANNALKARGVWGARPPCQWSRWITPRCGFAALSIGLVFRPVGKEGLSTGVTAGRSGVGSGWDGFLSSVIESNFCASLVERFQYAYGQNPLEYGKGFI
jgi:hypothetical protein